QRLLDKELIRAGDWEPVGDEAMVFRHVLIRDVTYDSIPKERRAGLHEQVVTWLEERLGEGAVGFEEILGYHFERAHGYRAELGLIDDHQGSLASRGARYLGSAGSRAYAAGDLPAARTLLERTAALLPKDDPVRLALLVNLGDALRER